MTQLGLLPTPPPRLTENQEHALNAVRSTPGGILADELGANIHERRLTDGHVGHTAVSRCPYCHRDGTQMLQALKKKGLVTRRRKTGRWQPTGGRAVADTARDLPESF